MNLNEKKCVICNNSFYTKSTTNELYPWDCPRCNKDSFEQLQVDLNDLYEKCGMKAFEMMDDRKKRIEMINDTLWKKHCK